MRKIVLALGLLAPMSASAGPVDTVLEKLGTSSNGCPQDFDYFPSGGMRNFYCHAKTILPYESLAKLAGVPIFLYGPHSQSALSLSSETSFGGYNPQFVDWMNRQVMTAARDPKYRAATQPIYDQYVRPLARLYLSVLRELESDPAAMSRAVSGYRNYRTMDPNVRSALYEQEPNLYPPARAWWLRRMIDGTSDEFKRALTDFMSVYDPTMVQNQPTPVTPPPVDASIGPATGNYAVQISGATNGPLKAGPISVEEREGQLTLRAQGTTFVGRVFNSAGESRVFSFTEDRPKNVNEVFAGTVNENRFTGTWIDHLGRKGTFTLVREKPPAPPPTAPAPRQKPRSAKDLITDQVR